MAWLSCLQWMFMFLARFHFCYAFLTAINPIFNIPTHSRPVKPFSSTLKSIFAPEIVTRFIIKTSISSMNTGVKTIWTTTYCFLFLVSCFQLANFRNLSKISLKFLKSHSFVFSLASACFAPSSLRSYFNRFLLNCL